MNTNVVLDRAWRHERMAKGICCACGNPVEPERHGRQQCGRCKDKSNEKAKLRRKQQRLVARQKRERVCAGPSCETRFTPANYQQRFCCRGCFYRNVAQRRARQKPTPAEADFDLTPSQIQRVIDAAYRQIQRDRQEGRRLSAGDIAWQRTCDPVSSNAPDTQDLWGSRTRSPKAPRVGRAA